MPEAGVQDFSSDSEVVAICDADKERAEAFLKKFDLEIPYFSSFDPEGLETLISVTRPDVLLVGGPDHTHHVCIMAGLRHGLKVICEKPMVISSEEAKEILAEEAKGAGRLIVTHNYRYNPVCRKLKELLQQKKVGRITNIEMVYNLDTRHGASYFYRWNRQRRLSGGLSIHKSVHHLDLVNWFIDSDPQTVFAFSKLNYYGPQGAHRPRSGDGSPLTKAQMRQACPYFRQHFGSKGISPELPMLSSGDPLDLPYSLQYAEDRYIYDEEIDIEDTYAAVIRYQNGVMLSYSCNFSTPWEGFILAINGTEGRLEVSQHSNPDPTGFTPSAHDQDTIVFYPLFGGREEYAIPVEPGGHGGADPLLQRHLFSDSEEDHLNLRADSYAGALAVACGEAIWKSAKEGCPYEITTLLGTHFRSQGASRAPIS